MMWLLLISVGMAAFSGIPGLLLGRRTTAGEWIATGLNLLAAVLAGTALILHGVRPDPAPQVGVSWSLPLGRFEIGLDDLGALFLIPIYLISALGSVYGLSYWRQRRHVASASTLRFWWGILAAAMALIVLARDGVLFVMAWELMALAAFFLVATEEKKAEVRSAAWVYLVATHAGTLCLFGFFALLRQATGTYPLWPSGLGDLSGHCVAALFIVGGVGFGFKAGVMPLHVWLPSAHANAPSHVSAVLSGVMLKMGLYGIIRVAGLLPHPPLWWGGTLVGAGALSALLAIAFAAGQRDLKRLLAYSSIENLGIMVLGVGLATLGRSAGRSDWVVLGMGGALLHMLNHSLFKPLLFLGAGNVLHAAHTRQMDLLGGLGRKMPKTLVLFLIGAVAICGLPPLNGFVGELFLYVGLFRTVIDIPSHWGWIGLATPVLALVGALALATFVKVLGIAFAGQPRSGRARHAHDPDARMLGPMWVLGGLCVLIGVAPGVIVGLLDRAVGAWARTTSPLGSIATYVPIRWMTATAIALLAAVALAGLAYSAWRATGRVRQAATWDCGYPLPTARMQYSGSSFSQMIIELLGWVLRPGRKSPEIRVVFPAPSSFASDVPDVVLDRGLVPAFNLTGRLLAPARVIQRGTIQVYLLYVLAILVVLLLMM